MAAYHRVHDSRHQQADCQNRDHLRNHTLGNPVWATFFTCIAFAQVLLEISPAQRSDIEFVCVVYGLTNVQQTNSIANRCLLHSPPL